MSKCPFWSTQKEKIECDSECPILNKNFNEDSEERCIFCECSFDNATDIRNILKKEYDFMNISIYEDDTKLNITY